MKECRDRYLLVDPAQNQPDKPSSSRLSHDTLAPLVRARFDESDLPGQRARRILENRAVDWKGGKSGEPLDEAGLQNAEAGRDGMRTWNEDEGRLVEASRKGQRIRKRSRRKLWEVIAAAAILVLIATVSSVLRGIEAEQQRNIAVAEQDEARRQAAIAKSRELAASAADVMEKEPGKQELAVLLGIEAIRATHQNVADTMTTEAINVIYPAIKRSRYLLVTLMHEDVVNYVAWGPDGRLATASYDDTARVWDMSGAGAREMFRLVHDERVNHVALGPGGRLATASYDDTARVWDVSGTEAREVFRLAHGGPVNHVVWGPDGRLASASDDNTARIWLTKGNDLIAYGCTKTGRNLSTHEWQYYMGDEPYRKTCPNRP